MARLVLLNKPYGVLCQFTDRPAVDDRASAPPSVSSRQRRLQDAADDSVNNAHVPRPTLADFLPIPGVYAAGRLDFDSEGLVVLTDDGAVQARIADPRHKMRKRYVVQVSGLPDTTALARLRSGVTLRDGPARALRIEASEPVGWPRDPPVRHPHPTTWLMLEIDEGRNRQVRRMLAAVGHPVLRLVRTRVGPWQVDGIGPGEFVVTSVHAPVDRRRDRPLAGERLSPLDDATRPRRDGPRPSTRSTPRSRRPGAPSSRTPRPS